MKLNYLFAVLIFLASCGNGENGEKADLKKKIKASEEELYSGKDKTPNPAKADPLITLYLDYARAYPKDEDADEYYFKAAELSNSIDKHKEAISLFETVRVNYPKSEKAPYALFLQGFIYENNLKDYSKAKEAYSKVITDYPKHELAKQAEILIQNLGKSEEELIREFEEKSGVDKQ